MSDSRLETDMFTPGVLEDLISKAANVAKPKAVYRECKISERFQNAVIIQNVTFTSRTLRKMLENTDRVYGFVCTCGIELNRLAETTDDPLISFVLESIKAHALTAAVDFLTSAIETTFQLDHAAMMSPGSADNTIWPLEQQQFLFQLLEDGPNRIDVQLTESCLMLPNKSVSGFLFQTGTSYESCKLCTRENCSGRRASFDAALSALLSD